MRRFSKQRASFRRNGGSPDFSPASYSNPAADAGLRFVGRGTEVSRNAMNVEYHKWWSPALQQDAELKVHGHALNFLFRHPDVFDGVIALSGVYGARSLLGDYMDGEAYVVFPLLLTSDLCLLTSPARSGGPSSERGLGRSVDSAIDRDEGFMQTGIPVH